MTQQVPQRPQRRRAYDGKDVLPPALLATVQSHVHTCFVYVPSPQTAARVERDREIVTAAAAGSPAGAIAVEFDLTERRVAQILARARARAAAQTPRPAGATP